MHKWDKGPCKKKAFCEIKKYKLLFFGINDGQNLDSAALKILSFDMK